MLSHRVLAIGFVLCAGVALAAVSGPANFLSSYPWIADRDGFGGYSALDVSPDGSSFTVISDRGHLTQGTFLRQDGQITGLHSDKTEALNIPRALLGKEPEFDSEGMAQDTNGQLYVSFETDNRILVRASDGTWSALPNYTPITGLPNNRGIEALALSPDGAVLAIPEHSNGLTKPFPILRYKDKWSVAFNMTRTQGFVPVGADFDDQGRLYVLERGFSGFGFKSRVRRFDPSSSGLASGDIVFTSETRQHDNLEGLAIWTDTDGRTRLTMVSDDNQRFFQRTEFVEYVLPN